MSGNVGSSSFDGYDHKRVDGEQSFSKKCVYCGQYKFYLIKCKVCGRYYCKDHYMSDGHTCIKTKGKNAICEERSKALDIIKNRRDPWKYPDDRLKVFEAIESLGTPEHDDEQVIKVLADLLNCDYDWYRRTAVISLGNIGNPSAIDYMVILRDEGWCLIRYDIANALESFGDERGMELLNAISEKENFSDRTRKKIEEAFFNIGLQLYNNMHYETAIPFFTRAYEKNPNNPEYSYYLGLSKMGCGQYSDAAKNFADASIRDSKNPIYSYNEGLAYINGGLYGMAKKCFFDAVKKDPKNKAFYDSLWEIYDETQNYGDAVKELSECLGKETLGDEPRHSEYLYYYLYQAYCKLGDYTTALRNIEKAIKRNPNDEDYSKALKIVQEKLEEERKKREEQRKLAEERRRQEEEQRKLDDQVKFLKRKKD